MIGRIIARRVALVIPLLLGVTALNFALLSSAPGDPVVLLFGEGGAPDVQTLHALREKLSLDRPALSRFVSYVGELARGNLGQSILQGRPVADTIAERLPATLLLAGVALVIAGVLGLGLGVALMWLVQRAPRWERVAFLALLMGNQPPIVSGVILIVVFTLTLNVLPAQGLISPRGGGGPLDVAAHLVLPAFTLALQPMLAVARVTRARLTEIWQRDHVRSARASGVPEWRILWRHALPLALTAPLTMLALSAAHWAGGAVLAESVFAWPGIGRLAVEATLGRDYPLILGVILTATTLLMVANLAADLLVALIDPRTRHA